MWFRPVRFEKPKRAPDFCCANCPWLCSGIDGILDLYLSVIISLCMVRFRFFRLFFVV